MLLDFIKRNINPGSKLHTDCWKGYSTDKLEWEGYSHDTVNHSKRFVEPDTGVHTQHIESTWRALRRMFTPGGVREYDLGDRLVEFAWRKNVRDANLDIFSELIKIMKA